MGKKIRKEVGPIGTLDTCIKMPKWNSNSTFSQQRSIAVAFSGSLSVPGQLHELENSKQMPGFLLRPAKEECLQEPIYLTHLASDWNTHGQFANHCSDPWKHAHWKADQKHYVGLWLLSHSLLFLEEWVQLTGISNTLKPFFLYLWRINILAYKTLLDLFLTGDDFLC